MNQSGLSRGRACYLRANKQSEASKKKNDSKAKTFEEDVGAKVFITSKSK